MNDYDSDGCQDISEDNDDDNDNILDSSDDCQIGTRDGLVAPPTIMIQTVVKTT